MLSGDRESSSRVRHSAPYISMVRAPPEADGDTGTGTDAGIPSLCSVPGLAFLSRRREEDDGGGIQVQCLDLLISEHDIEEIGETRA